MPFCSCRCTCVYASRFQTNWAKVVAYSVVTYGIFKLVQYFGRIIADPDKDAVFAKRRWVTLARKAGRTRTTVRVNGNDVVVEAAGKGSPTFVVVAGTSAFDTAAVVMTMRRRHHAIARA